MPTKRGIVGDYGVSLSVAQDEAEDLLDAARDFVGKVKDYLDKWAQAEVKNVSERILMCGNEAMAEAAIIAGCDAYFGYPITPQNEITAYMARRMPEEGRVFIQSESELAAINMVFGASATGKRAMTSSSSPGISLMQEGMSYLAGAELPAVVVNVMRGGPGLGNIAPSQGGLLPGHPRRRARRLQTIVLGPASVQEMADCMPLAFDLADQYRMTVMILADGVLGQMMEPLMLEPKPRRKLPPKDWALTGRQRPASRTSSARCGSATASLEEHNKKLQAKYREIQEKEVRCEEYRSDDAEIVIVAYGIVARIARAAVDQGPGGGHSRRPDPADHAVAVPVAADQPGRRAIPRSS